MPELVIQGKKTANSLRIDASGGRMGNGSVYRTVDGKLATNRLRDREGAEGIKA